MKKIMTFLLVTAFCFLITNTAFAFAPTPTLAGPTGLIRMPTANVIGYKEFNIGVNYGAETNAQTQTGQFYYLLNLGTFKGLELGIVGGSEPGQNQLREGVFINMKYGLAAEGSDYPLYLAIGAENLTSRTQTDTYLVATKFFRGGWKMSFGAMFDFPGDKFRPLGMLGLSIPMADSLELVGEVFAGETVFQADVGIKIFLHPNFAATISGLNITSSTQARDNPTICGGFSLINPLF